ncbi:cilia- and flagella-associated protein 97-like [Cataglyphis hispanica]|uniref:cilia- and flagella-associated protein 97-like n=1 Tax=Cataglyphis hispanica TaxID=1086592 RepID=UPI00217FD60A|nr:cilia- and flagella-associated protein 97-like [Cataglyphis hispanica]
MANSDETKIICGCLYSPEDESVKDNFNDVPNIHEIDEESETEETTILEQLNPSAPAEDDYVAQETKDSSDDESAYAGESFYSDESCDESELTNIASGSLNPSSLFRIGDLQRSQSSKEPDADVRESRWKDESFSISDELSRAVTMDKLTRPKRCKRWNMSFTDEEMRRIERENELLLRKIMAQQKPRHKILGERSAQPRISSSAINRKKLQKRIEDDNLLLLRKIQQAKSCVFANASKTGCRLTFL